jgi:hypothetical protein
VARRRGNAGQGRAPVSGTVARGPRLESVGWPGEKGNGSGPGEHYPSRFIQNISKRLELFKNIIGKLF